MGAGRRKRARERQKERLALGWVLKGSLLEVMFKQRCDDRKEPARLISKVFQWRKPQLGHGLG